MKFKLNTRHKKMLADTTTPVNIYLKLRDKFANPILLESSDYHGNDNTFSFLCFQPLARFEVNQTDIISQMPDQSIQKKAIPNTQDTDHYKQREIVEAFRQFVLSFESDPDQFNFPQNGIFGYTSYDAVRYFEDLTVKTYSNSQRQIPDMLYCVYQFVIAIDHFKNELYLFEHRWEDAPETAYNADIEEVVTILRSQNFPAYTFTTQDKERSNMDDPSYLKMVAKGIEHCHRGDVFQIVLSRQYSQGFQGDEFNVYRALRSINPSPYLFYFDYGNFKIFGSSPEAQLRIKGELAEIHPIAGTVKRTGNDAHDAEQARKLFDDEKENAEHVMLVDLARNDLSVNGDGVEVETFKEIQYYSHLIHLVSKVTAQVKQGHSKLHLYADTFPAGTLSGAPKYKAMELINQYENQNRGYYGGAIGFMSFQGDINHAIMIRTFLSKNNRLYYQAGGGIVAKSSPEGELDEVGNKLRALRTAIQSANEL